MNKQTLWLITELFPPEETSTAYIFGEIANALADKYTVKVICGPEVYDKNKKKDENNNFLLNSSIVLCRVEGISEDKNKVSSRVKKFLGMTVRMYEVARRNIRKEDKVLMATNPFPLIVPMSRLKKKRGFELQMLVHDIFPEPLKFRMNLPNLVYNALYRVFGKAYASTNLLISLGRDMTEMLRMKTEKYNPNLQIVQMENWGDVVNISPKERSSDMPDDKVVIQYAGNIGEAQGVQQFIEYIVNPEVKNVIFSIWGTGSSEEKIKKYVNENKLEDKVQFYGSYFRSQQTDVLNFCDIALVSLRNIIKGIGVPSKSYNIMAAGKPILFIGPLDSEIALTVKENGIGFCFDEFDKDGIRNFLQSLDSAMIPQLKIMGKKARQLGEQMYSEDAILNRFKEIV